MSPTMKGSGHPTSHCACHVAKGLSALPEVESVLMPSAEVGEEQEPI